jgi:2-polyprenyl-6-methoxyphenol hydroxylase-like FAD-dependent oxidoreductase
MAGAAWLPRTEAASVAADDDPRHPLVVHFRANAVDTDMLPVRGRIVILAGGLTDHVRLPGQACSKRVRPGSRIGVGSVVAGRGLDLASGELVMAVGRSGYCGLVRLEDGAIDVAAAIDRHVLVDASSVGEAVAGILDEAGAGAHGIAMPRATLARAAFRATPPLTHAAPLVAGSHRRIFRVGDAAGYVEPFTGEGMGWALSGSRLLTTALLATADPAAAYEQAHAACFRRLHGRCLRVAAALRQPWLVGSAIRMANAAPWAAKRIVPLLVGGRGETPS